MKFFLVGLITLLPGAPAITVRAAYAQTISFLHEFNPSDSFWPAAATGIGVNATGIYVAGCAWRGEGFVRKLGSAGDEMWTRRFGGCAGAVATDAAGIYVANRASPDQAFLRKYDIRGDELWTRPFRVGANDASMAVTAGSDAVYVAGTGFLRKYTRDGHELWSRQLIVGVLPEIVHAMAPDTTSVYVAGRTPYQVFLRKYTSDGDEQWTRHGGALPDANYGVARDATGIYVAGQSGSSAFAQKYDADGNELWIRRFGWAGQSYASAVAVDESGLYVAGNATSAPGQCRSGAFDIFVRKYDISGNELWTRQFGASGSDLARGVALDPGGVYVAGAVQEIPRLSRPLLAKLEKSQAPVSDTRPRIACIANAASNVDMKPIALSSYDDAGVAPGEILTVLGHAIGPEDNTTAQVNAGGFLPTSLAGVRVLFNGVAAPLLYVSTGQVNAIAPYRIAGWSSVEIEVEYRGERSNPVTAHVVRAEPGIFTRDSSGVGEALALNEDGSLNSQENPASSGSMITIYATGEGLGDPAVADGQIFGSGVTKPREQISIWACCDVFEQAYTLEEVQAVGVAGSVAGLLEIRARLPRGPRSSTPLQVPIMMQIGSRLTDWQVHVTVR
jgi:uncharacterized protein (TIGR03437 family)